MRTTDKVMMILAFGLMMILLAGCQKATPAPVSETACSTDSDCACGTHITTGDCFAGNKAFVNVEKQCPDYCTGIAAMFETKCIDNDCMIVRIETPASCTTDADCIPDACCHPTGCKAGTEMPECAAVLCDASCQPGTLDCGGKCLCQDGKCAAQLNDLPAGEKECQADSDCVPEQCCHATSCIPQEQKGVCNLACTMNCQAGTMDCGGSCTCESGKCTAHLNSI